MATEEMYPLALTPGTVLAGQYTIDKVLGQGGFGITYRATDYKTKEKVAIKEFFPDTLAYREMTSVISYPGERTENYQYGKESFLQEAQTLAEFIGCENIVRIHSYFEENSTAYFVMDYIEGTSFDEYLKERGGRISCEEAERILIPIMDALAIVHSKGIVHRDVTPDNIYLTNDGTIKLLDFGAARYSLGDKSRSLDVILKHGFAPKEQYTRRGKQGPFTDVYSLGATFYFALTGVRPPDSVERLDEDYLVPPSGRGVQMARSKEKTILKALSIQPADRYQSMVEFKKAYLSEKISNVQPSPVAQLVSGTPQAQMNQSNGQYNQMSQPAPVQQKKSKKPLIIALISIAVVVSILSIIMAIITPTIVKTAKGENETTQFVEYEDQTETTTRPPKETTSPPKETTAPPKETTAPPETNKGSVTIIGNTVGNIRNNGYVTEDGEWWIDNNSTTIYHNQDVVLEVDSGKVTNLIKDGDYLYYIHNKRVCSYQISNNKHWVYSNLDKYGSDYMELYLSKDYYFIHSDGKLYRISRHTGEEEESLDVWKRAFTFCGEYLYYVWDDDYTDEKNYLSKVSSLDFSSNKDDYWYTKDGFAFSLVTSDGEYVYSTMIKNSQTKCETIISKYSSDFQEITDKFDISDKCKELVGERFWISSINVVDNQIGISLNGPNEYDESWNSYGLYHLTVNGSNLIWDTMRDFGTGTEYIVIEKRSNIYCFEFMYGGKLKLIKYDFNGNNIK